MSDDIKLRSAIYSRDYREAEREMLLERRREFQLPAGSYYVEEHELTWAEKKFVERLKRNFEKDAKEILGMRFILNMFRNEKGELNVDPIQFVRQAD